jgi:hypothetical protein
MIIHRFHLELLKMVRTFAVIADLSGGLTMGLSEPA